MLFAVHPLALPLTVFGLVFSLWLLGLLLVDSRRRSQEKPEEILQSASPTWLQESLGTDESFQLDDESHVDVSREARGIRFFLFGLLFFFMLVWFLIKSMFIAMSVAVVVYVVFRRIRSLREGKKAAQAQKDCLFAMQLGTRVLRSGHTISGMFRVLAREVRGSVGRAFVEIIRREELGESTEDAISAVLLKSKITEMRAFGLTLLIQSGAGGDLSIVTDRLTKSMEERARILRKTRTLLAYGRTTATLMVVLAFILFFALSFLHDGYWNFLLNDPVGRTMLAISIILMGIGLHVVQRYMRSDVVYSKAVS